MSRIRKAEDDGFTLVEVLVAMIVFALLAGAALTMVVGSLKTAVRNKDGSAARQIAQADFETLKGLVFQAASGATLLSTYYPNLTATTTRGTAGYVAATSTSRWTADGDPATGAFYRNVVSTAPTSSVYSRYLALQFVDNAGAAVTPAATYSPTVLPLPSPIVRATETVVWNRLGRHTFTMQSELTTGRASAEQASGSGNVIAVRVSGLDSSVNVTNPAKIAVQGPSITMNADLTDNSVAAVSAQGAGATDSLGPHVEGAQGVANAPADETAASTNGAAASLVDGARTYGTFGSSTTSGLVAKASFATPLVSTSAAPATATLGSTNGSTSPLTMSTLDAVTAAPPKLQLGSTDIVRSAVPAACSGTCTTFTSQGWLATADNGVAHSVDATVKTNATAGVGLLFPTGFAPNGLVVLELTSASLTCHAGGTYPTTSAATVTATYSGTVKYWTGNGTTGGYTSVAVSSADSTSPLAAINLATTQVWTYAGQPVYLGDYISSWSSATAPGLAAIKQTTADNHLVSAKLDGFLTATTTGLRSSDLTGSAVTTQLGLLSCAAADAR